MVACAVPAGNILASVRAYPTHVVAHPPAIGLVSNQGSFQRVPVPNPILGGPRGIVQGDVVQGGVHGAVQGGPPLAGVQGGGVQGGGVQGAPGPDVPDAHVEVQLHDYKSKLQQYKAQLQTMHTQETQDGPPGGLSEDPPGEPQGGSAVVPIAVVALQGLPTAALQGVPTAVARLVAASAVADAQAQIYIASAGSPLAQAPMGERAPSADELARRDLASSAEVWQACQATDGEGDDGGDGDVGADGHGGDGDGAAAELIDLARGSTAGTIVDVSVVDDDGAAAHTEEAHTQDQDQEPMTEGDVLEACSAPAAPTLPLIYTTGAPLCTTLAPPSHHPAAPRPTRRCCTQRTAT